MQLEFTAVFRKVAEGYVGFVEELPGANTHAVYPNWTRHFGIGSMNLRGDEFNGNTPPGFGWAQAL